MFFRPSKEGDLTVVFWTGQWKKKSSGHFRCRGGSIGDEFAALAVLGDQKW